MQEWLVPLVKSSFFIHFFSNELYELPGDLLAEIHSQTRLQLKDEDYVLEPEYLVEM